MDGCGVRLYVVRVDRSIGRDADGERERERRTDGRMDGWLAMPGGVAGWLSIDQRIDAIRPNGRRERTESDGRGSYGRLLLQQYSLFVAYPDRLCGPPTFELVVYVLCLCAVTHLQYVPTTVRPPPGRDRTNRTGFIFIVLSFCAADHRHTLMVMHTLYGPIPTITASNASWHRQRSHGTLRSCGTARRR
jgi:hypothetical protein